MPSPQTEAPTGQATWPADPCEQRPALINPRGVGEV